MSTPLFERGIIEGNDQTRARLAHLEEIKELVGNPYPNKFERTKVTRTPEGEDTITSLVAEFSKHVPEVKEGERPTAEQLEAANAELSKIGVRVSGRLATPPRVMGKAAFVHLSDGRERLQIYVRKQEAKAVSNDTGREVEEAESGWKLFQLLDHGDFVGVDGFLFVTKTGELSVHVREIQFLSKALLPMPDKMHGISDPEIRQRQRYADLIASSLKVRADEEAEGEGRELSTREVFERRSKLITAMRRYLDDHGYIEVETPMLSPLATGAAARPFVTHHNALDIDLYLRIAPELYLKRLLVGGFERVYELNRNFRNEGISTRHNPEFTMLEFYTAYKDVNWMMDFCEEMLRKIEQKIIEDLGPKERETYKPKFIMNERWPRLSMKEAIALCWKSQDEPNVTKEMLDDPRMVFGLHQLLPKEIAKYEKLPYTDGMGSYTPEDLRRGVLIGFKFREEVQNLNIPEEALKPEDTARRIQDIFEMLEKSPQALFHGILERPTFIINHPKVVSPLSKASPDDPTVAERFELYVGQMEVANGFSELNDPAEQLERFEDQARQRERGDEEAMQTDTDYVRALSYGMPPAAGIGIGIDRMTMLLTNRRSIRDVILFPHMRPVRQASEEKPAESESSDSKEAV